jgi:hypothetical protein
MVKFVVIIIEDVAKVVISKGVGLLEFKDVNRFFSAIRNKFFNEFL